MSRLSPVVGQDIYNVGQSIVGMGKTDKSRDWYGLWERPDTERSPIKPKGYADGLQRSSKNNPETNVV